MPQLLNKLGLDASVDWGVLAVYTCKKSCDFGAGNGYAREFLFRQFPSSK